MVFATGIIAQANSEEILLGLQAPEYQLKKDSHGFDAVEIESFSQGGLPGNPLLPAKAYDIALPPDVNEASVTVKVVSRDASAIPGAYELAPANPPSTFVEGMQLVRWGPNEATIVDGRNILVYAADSLFPSANISAPTFSKMRRWNFARIVFNPVQYNPVTGQVVITRELKLRVTFSRKLMSMGERATSLDTIADRSARDAFVNYETAKSWYQGMSALGGGAATMPGYAIITTSSIINGSAKLADFIAHKEARGFAVEVITEAQWGGLTGQAPDGTAEKIRKWLQNNYVSKGIQYVLLIGNPDPAGGDVPMKQMWPRYTAGFYIDYRDAPSDYFYADLTGNWDLNGDTIFGDYAGDSGTGGVDFSPEVYVGRIPVYQSLGDWQTSLDNILTKTINYENEPNAEWRKSFLLPMSFSDPSTDGALLGEAVKDNYLTPNGYSAWTMYPQGNAACGIDSPTDSDQELRGGYVVQQRWKENPVGAVFWWGHGSASGAYTGYGGCWDYNGANAQILQSTDASELDDTKPAVVYQNSCDNGHPEVSYNLGYTLLRNGAIGTVSATRVSWYSVGSWCPSHYSGDNAGIGYFFLEGVVNGETFGKALFDSKSGMGTGWEGETWMNLMGFNLYGDPALSISYSAGVPTATPIPATPIPPTPTPLPTATPTTAPTQPPAPPHPTATPTPNPNVLTAGRYDDTNARIRYQRGWKRVRNRNAYMRSFHYAPRSLMAYFYMKGRKFDLMYMQGTLPGSFRVYIDGIPVKTLSTRSRFTRRRIWPGPALNPAVVHTVVIKGYRASVDGVVVY